MDCDFTVIVIVIVIDDVCAGWDESAEEQVDCVWEQEPAAGAGEEWSHGHHQHDQLCQDWTRWLSSEQSEQI